MVRIKLTTVAVVLFLGISNIFGQDLETAKYYTLAERYDDAKEMLNSILQKEPNNAKAYFYLGQTIIKEYLTDSLSNSLSDVCQDAKKAFETGFQKDSVYRLNLVGKGMIEQLCNNDTTTAGKLYRRAMATFPKNKKKYTEDQALICVYIAFAKTLGKIEDKAGVDAFLAKAKEIAPNSFEVTMQAGQVYLERNDGTNAIANFNKAAFVKPNSPLPKIKIGDLYLAAKSYNIARSNYEEAKSIDSTNAIVYKSLGVLWNTANRYDLAKEYFRKYLQYSGGNVPSKVSYINSLYKTKDYEEAISVIKEVQALDDSRNYLNRVAGYSNFDKKNPNYEEANTYMAKFFSKAKESSITARDYAYYGRTLIRLKKDSTTTSKGIGMLAKSYDMTPDEKLIADMASAYYSINDYQGAIKLYTQKIASGKSTNFDVLQLGRAYMQVKDYVNAGNTFDKAVAAEPNNMDALTRCATAYANQDPDSKLGLAKPKYEQIIKLGLTDPKKYSKELFESYKFMGSYYLYGDKSNASQGEDYYKKILTLDPTNKEWMKTAYSGLAALYTDQKRWVAAREMFQELLKLDPGNKTAQSAIKSLTATINTEKVMNN